MSQGFNYAASNVESGPRTAAPPAPSHGTRVHGSVPARAVYPDDALCRGNGNEYGNVWLYPNMHEPAVVNAAVKVCARCPVSVECGAAARRERPIIGIRAGKVHAGEKETDGTQMRSCVICGDSFKGYGAAKSCGTVCRIELTARRDSAYNAKKRKRS